MSKTHSQGVAGIGNESETSFNAK